MKVELEVADINDIRAEAESADHALGKERYPPGMTSLMYANTPELE